MKTVIVLVLVSASALAAQPPPADKPTDVPGPGTGAALRTSGRPRIVPVPVDRQFSGVLVDAKRAGNPLKLLDPRAPGDPYINVSRDPITGRAQGIKLFEIRF